MLDRREFLLSSAAAALGGVAFAAEAEPYTCIAAGSTKGARIIRGNRRPLASQPVEVSEDSLFEIASLTKTFTALLIAIAYERGKVDIDAPFVKALPGFTPADSSVAAITLRDLATHTSGFTDGWLARAGVYGKAWPFAEDAAFDRELFKVRPELPRRKQIAYCCTNYLLLGVIAERLYGVDLDTAAKREIFAPLGMNDTTWKNCPGDARTVQIFTHGAVPPGLKGDEIARGMKRCVGNAGVFSNLKDLLKYAGDLVNRRSFPAAVYDLLFTSSAQDGKRRRSFGFDLSPGTNPPGWSSAAINHSGYTGQYLAVDPVAKSAAVVLTNLNPRDRGERAAAFEKRRELAAEMCL